MNVMELHRAERKVLHLLCNGLTNRQIAEELDKSIHTVDKQVHVIFKKLGVSNRVEAMLRVVEEEVRARQREDASLFGVLLRCRTTLTKWDELTASDVDEAVAAIDAGLLSLQERVAG